MPAFSISALVGMPKSFMQRVGDELPRLLELTLVLGGFARVGEERVVGGAGLVGVVGIGHVQEDEERPVAMGFEPGGEAVDVLPRRLARSLLGQRAVLMQLLEPLVQVRQLADEEHGRQAEGGVAGLAVGLREGDGRARQPILELLDPVGARVERGQD